MNTKRTVFALSLAALLALPAAMAQTPASPNKPAPDPMMFARGAAKWAGDCQRCHALRDPKEFSDEGWQVIVTHMRLQAGLTGQDARDIRAFLQQSNQ